MAACRGVETRFLKPEVHLTTIGYARADGEGEGEGESILRSARHVQNGELSGRHHDT